jgi:hypothetical protein
VSNIIQNNAVALISYLMEGLAPLKLAIIYNVCETCTERLSSFSYSRGTILDSLRDSYHLRFGFTRLLADYLS